MKLLVANYRYYVSGGPERYMFGLMDQLEAAGHECIPFSVRYSRNRPTPWEGYFVPPLADADSVYFREHRGSLRSLPRTLSRLFHSPEVSRAARRLVADTRPDAALVLHYLRKLSPSLLTGLKKAGLPVAVRLSDFAMLCPQAHCLRQGRHCTLCMGGRLWPSVRHRCVHGSLPASLLNTLATMLHRVRGYFDLVDRFVTPTRFMHAAMVEAGFAPERVIHIPTFVDPDLFRPSPDRREPGLVVYAGRLDESKGAHVLVEAMGLLASAGNRHLRLDVAGDGPDAYVRRLRERVETLGLADTVRFLGAVPQEEMPALLARAELSVVPSLWPENMPNALLESFACGTPVVASDLGSLPELVIPGETGLLFPPGDAEALAETLDELISKPDTTAELAKTCRKVALERHSPRAHVACLLDLLRSLA